VVDQDDVRDGSKGEETNQKHLYLEVAMTGEPHKKSQKQADGAQHFAVRRVFTINQNNKIKLMKYCELIKKKN
jgi:hypothetical protein